jgi:pimeloyl-ACP methyl ester carboxylesterase
MHVLSRRGRTLLWLHGLGESSLCFEAIVDHPRLAGFASVAPDLPGYGRTPPRPTPPSLPALADLLAEWLRARGGPPPVVVGHSMGGVLGVLLAERHPGAIAALIDVDGNVSPGDCTYSGRAAAMPRDAFVAHGLDALRAFVAERAADDRAHAGYLRSLAEADAATLHQHAGDLVAFSAPEDGAARRAALAIPVAYVAGVPGGACARSKELLDRAGVTRHDVFPSGHWPFVDQPDAFAEVVAELAAAA